MTSDHRRRGVLAGLAVLVGGPARADMTVESFTAAPTVAELASFEDEIAGLEPGTGGNLTPKNDWAQHGSGQRTCAMGLVYEMTHERAVLDRMIVFCDALLASRNDLAPPPVGQHVIWTGVLEPVWPNGDIEPIATAGEQGDAIGHLGYCARLIFETPSLADATVSDGDPNGYGATYRARALRFLAEADHSLDEHVLFELLDLSDRDRMYWGRGSGTTGSVPWNQQAMFTYALQNLAAAHLVLADDPARAARYEAIVQASVDWFFSAEPGTASPRQGAQGRTVYLWSYRPPSGVEDWSHSNLDIQGLYRAYASGRYGISDAEMLPLANTFLDVIRRGPDDYAGRVDGSDGGGNSSPTSYVRPGWYVAALFRPEDYLTIVSEDLGEGDATRDITRFAYFLWIKCKRHPRECVLPDEVDAGPADGGGGGEVDAGPISADVDAAGCGCRVGGGLPGASMWPLLLLLGLASRRRRARRGWQPSAKCGNSRWTP